MAEPTALRAQLVRAITMLSAMIYATALWLNRSSAFSDFHILHLGSRLVKDGRADAAYDPAAFSREWVLDPALDGTPAALQVFVSTPPFALAMRPLTYLDVDTAVIVWLALSLAAYFAGFRLLRLPMWGAPIGLTIPLTLTNLQLGQTGFFAFFWAALIYRLCADDRVVAAGAVAGLAVLKPTLLLGVALWWLLDWRRWNKALTAAAAVGSTFVLASVALDFEGWNLFRAALNAYDVEGQATLNQSTISEIINRSLGPDVGGHPLAIACYLAIGAIAMHTARRYWPNQHDILAGAAVIVSVIISPHLLLYDATMLIVPLAVAVHRGGSRERIELLVGLVTVTTLLNILPLLVPLEPLAIINQWVVPSTIGLIAAGFVWAQMMPDVVQPVARSGTTAATRAARDDVGDQHFRDAA